MSAGVSLRSVGGAVVVRDLHLVFARLGVQQPAREHEATCAGEQKGAS